MKFTILFAVFNCLISCQFCHGQASKVVATTKTGYVIIYKKYKAQLDSDNSVDAIPLMFYEDSLTTNWSDKYFVTNDTIPYHSFLTCNVFPSRISNVDYSEVATVLDSLNLKFMHVRYSGAFPTSEPADSLLNSPKSYLVVYKGTFECIVNFSALNLCNIRYSPSTMLLPSKGNKFQYLYTIVF
jgi:hypothetical protein